MTLPLEQANQEIISQFIFLSENLITRYVYSAAAIVDDPLRPSHTRKVPLTRDYQRAHLSPQGISAPMPQREDGSNSKFFSH